MQFCSDSLILNQPTMALYESANVTINVFRCCCCYILAEAILSICVMMRENNQVLLSSATLIFVRSGNLGQESGQCKRTDGTIDDKIELRYFIDIEIYKVNIIQNNKD